MSASSYKMYETETIRPIQLLRTSPAWLAFLLRIRMSGFQTLIPTHAAENFQVFVGRFFDGTINRLRSLPLTHFTIPHIHFAVGKKAYVKCCQFWLMQPAHTLHLVPLFETMLRTSTQSHNNSLQHSRQTRHLIGKKLVQLAPSPSA